MSLSTTVALILSTIESVAGVENVQAKPGIPTDLEELLATLHATEGIQRWILFYATSAQHGHSIECSHTQLSAIVLAEGTYREDDDSYIQFAERVAAVQLAILDSTLAVDGDGVSSVSVPTAPEKAESGDAVWRVQFSFQLEEV